MLNLQVIEHVKLGPLSLGKDFQGKANGYCYNEFDDEIPVALEFDYLLAERDSDAGPGHSTEATITRITSNHGREIPLNSVTYDVDMLVEEIDDAAAESAYDR